MTVCCNAWKRLLVRFPSFRPPLINALKVYKCCYDSKKARAKRARENFRVIWRCMSRLLCFLMKLNRVNRIFVYCVPTFCVLRTVSPLPNTAYQGGGGVTLVLDVKKNSRFSLYTSYLHQLIHCTWCTQTILTKIAISMFFSFLFFRFCKNGIGRFEKQDQRTVA